MICPNCGARVPRKSRACPECGSDDRTGWRSSEDVDYESTGLPEDVDYDDFLERERLAPRGVTPAGRRRLWIALVALLAAAAIVAAIVLRP